MALEVIIDIPAVTITGTAVVTHSPPTSEVRGSNPEPYVGKVVASYRWSAVYTTET